MKTAISFAALLSLSTPILAGEEYAIAWVIGDSQGLSGQRVAMLVTAEINGRTCAMQVDTGINAAVAWHFHDSPKGSRVPVVVKFAGLTVEIPASRATAKRLRDCSTESPSASLGNAFFERGTLSINLKTSTLSYSDEAELLNAPASEPLFYARWAPTGGHPLVELRHQDGALGYALLDTGSASAGLLVLSSQQWNLDTKSLPLRSGGNVRSFSVMSWGRQMPCYSARAVEQYRAGYFPLKGLLVTYCPAHAFTSPVQLRGVLGMQPFQETVITIDYRSGRWLAVEAN